MTTIVSVRRNGQVVMAGDGQVSLGNTVMKGNARKVFKLADGSVLAGFKKCNLNLEKASVELAKQWRSDKALRKLEAMLAVADRSKSFIITGNGDVVQPENDLISMGSGGDFARSAAIALLENTDLTAEEIANKALTIASNICVFTNSFKTVEIINY